MDWKQVSADFRAKYEGCYCFVTLEGTTRKELFYLNEVEVQRNAPMLYLQNERHGTIILKYDDSKSDVEFGFPDIGLFAFEHKTYMIRRRHDRQWKGATNQATISCQDILAAIDSSHNILNCPRWTEQLVQAMFAPRPSLTIKSAISLLGSAVAIPLSSQFALSLPLTEDREYILFYYESPIGLVSPENETVVLKEDQFRQEFDDFIASTKGHNTYEIYR